jgi:phospholipid/cholesterol/gamma-HCH transport system permease protein
MDFVIKKVDSWGRFLLLQIQYIWQLLAMVYLSLRATFLDQAQGLRTIIGVLSSQIYFTGFQALPLISVLALATGGLLILQGMSNLTLVGGSQMLGPFLIALFVREVAPLLTALVVIARSGTAVASEIGSMRANREIDALESMGINPLSYIVFPRLVGGVISVVGLCFYFILIGLIGGFLITQFLHKMPLNFYLDSLLNAFEKIDVFIFLIKSFSGGIIIFIVSCFQGLSVKRSPHEVPQVTTQAVVKSILYVTLLNLLVSGLFYIGRLKEMGVL